VIFVTVGSQMAFDRMINAVDRWSGQSRRKDIFMQIGPTTSEPRHVEWARVLKPIEFQEHMRKASVIVAHAGMGTILTALELGKPILVMPRRGDLQETRNDHQVATAKHFEERGCVSVAFDEESLVLKLNKLIELKPSKKISRQASPELLERLRIFVDSI
jgi:UDP-N-acetylglucosamine transferase subunit ALG13